MNERRRAAVAFTLLLAACEGSKPTPRVVERHEAARTAAISQLAQRHDADIEWRKQFDDLDRSHTYTYQLQRALVRADHRPVVFVGALDDIIAHLNEEYEVRGHDSLTSAPAVYFSLKCEAGRLSSVLTRTPDTFDEFAVVALVEGLSRPMLRGAVDEESVILESARTIVAIGRCLEVIHLKE